MFSVSCFFHCSPYHTCTNATLGTRYICQFQNLHKPLKQYSRFLFYLCCNPLLLLAICSYPNILVSILLFDVACLVFHVSCSVLYNFVFCIYNVECSVCTLFGFDKYSLFHSVISLNSFNLEKTKQSKQRFSYVALFRTKVFLDIWFLISYLIYLFLLILFILSKTGTAINKHISCLFKSKSLWLRR